MKQDEAGPNAPQSGQEQSLASPTQSTAQTTDPITFAFLKGPKRKRLAKACDACHKSKRRCDGTAPCSNCYFASKDCTYTDASGKLVPAPRSTRPDDAPDHRQRSKNSGSTRHRPPVPEGSNRVQSYNADSSQQQAACQDDCEDTSDNRKRCRYDDSPSTRTSSEPAPLSFNPQAPVTHLDPWVVRELENLFFAHCHPQRQIIHKPSFSSALSHSRIPCYLLYAMCALAAPLSKQRAVKTAPPRVAGVPYAQLAIQQMFDQSDKLIVESNLVTVQALLLLQSHEMTVAWPWTSSTKYQDLALKILEEDLKVHEQNHPILTPFPTSQFVFDAIDRECMRRSFWLIRFLQFTAFTFYYVPMPEKPLRLSMLRLPVDETSFELGVHSTLSEYLHVPAPRTQYASEMGHLIRITTIRYNIESTVRAAAAGSIDRADIESVVQDTEKGLAAWEASLPDHLGFSEESLQLQLSMYATSSNAGAWCYFMMHILHATCALISLDANFHAKGIMASAEQRTGCRDHLLHILSAIGNPTKNSFLVSAAFAPLYRYDLADHPQIQSWSQEFESIWGSELSQVILYGSRSHQVQTASSVQQQQQQQQQVMYTQRLQDQPSSFQQQHQHQQGQPQQVYLGQHPHQQQGPTTTQTTSQSQSQPQPQYPYPPFQQIQSHHSYQRQQPHHQHHHQRNTSSTHRLSFNELAIHDSPDTLPIGSLSQTLPFRSSSSYGKLSLMPSTNDPLTISSSLGPGGIGSIGVGGPGVPPLPRSHLSSLVSSNGGFGGLGGLAQAGDGGGGLAGGVGGTGAGPGPGSGSSGVGGSNLPSLKASGLLDSWVSRQTPTAGTVGGAGAVGGMAGNASSSTSLSPSSDLRPASGHEPQSQGAMQNQYGMDGAGHGSLQGPAQGQGQGIGTGTMSGGPGEPLMGQAGKSTMPVGLPWLEHE